MNPLVLMSDPRVAAIPVREYGKPLVDVRDHSFLVCGEPVPPGASVWGEASPVSS
ncbi:hypothetical protein [Streptomyces sp. E2N166]|uniref:hypothetical protein n=1 Tax=Streptomyces sp. E2N166 TaxID=1851909 RepID=UPI001EE91AA3|nr:hypothetical protein [Streptomyces sp. E2N166]